MYLEDLKNDILISFKNEGEDEVAIPEGVKIVAEKAFDFIRSSIKKVIVPESVELIKKRRFPFANI